MRVLGVAFRQLNGEGDDPESDLVLLGLVGIIDPPRSEVRDAVAVCRWAGIRPVMITGDHPLTAVAIANDLGISDTDRVLVGAELDHLDDEQFAAAVRDVSVFARVSPEHKLRIVGALQQQHQVVAMTGDGVNDAPALKRADIGVAMGITGTDVSKEAADMVLRDDNFATIVAAVEEGRVIYDNLRRFVSFAVAGNLGKIIVMLGWPIPFLVAGSDTTAIAFLPLQLLWLNLMTDGLLGLSMGVEPAEKTVMQRPPHSPSDGLWANGLGRRTVWVGLVIGAVTLGLGFGYYAADFDAMADRDVHDDRVHAGGSGVRDPVVHRVTAHDRLEDEPADARHRRPRDRAAAARALHAVERVPRPRCAERRRPRGVCGCRCRSVGARRGRQGVPSRKRSLNQSRMISPRWTRWSGDPERESSWFSPGKR